MSEVPTQYVKRGLWVNVDRGPIMGRTITTDVQTGTVVVALLAILVTAALSHLWNITLFALYQLRNDVPTDGLGRQQQALLRGSRPPITMVADLLKLCLVWRERTDRVFNRSICECLYCQRL